MATLERIRSKSVLLIVVIGVALLAFIIGDAITNSRNLFGDHTTVAKIGGTKIEYTDFSKKQEELNSQIENARRQNPMSVAQIDPQEIPQMALEQLISEKLLDEAVENAGIRVTPTQLSYYVLTNTFNGQRMNDIIQGLNNAGYNVSTPEQAYEIIFNPQRNGIAEADMEGFRNYWVLMEQETVQLIGQNTYLKLLMGTMKPNELDKKALYNDYVSTRNVNVAYKPYDNFNAEKYAPSDKELKAEYESRKPQYKVVEPTKDIAFIAVNVAVSEEDKAAASNLAQATKAAMVENGSNLSKDLRKEGVSVSSRELLEKNVPANIKNFVTTAPKDSVAIVVENMRGFTVVRMGDKTSEIDSIQLNLVNVLSPSLKDKVLVDLNSGLAIDSLASAFPVDSVLFEKEQWYPLFTAQGRSGAFARASIDSLMNAGGKYIPVSINTPYGPVPIFAQLTSKSSPKNVYTYSEATYELKPSSASVSAERDRLDDFLASNGKASSFVENAAKQGYNLQRMSLDASTSGVPGSAVGKKYYPDSRQVVRWVMIDGQPGDVSHIYESKDASHPALYAVAVLAEYDDYKPLTNSDVKNEITNRIRKSKVGDELMTQYAKNTSSMESVSEAMGVESRNTPSFRFVGNNRDVIDAAVMGKIAGSHPGKVVLIKGDNGIYAYQIVSEETEDYPYSEEEYVQEYQKMINPDIEQMLRGGQEYTNNIYKFVAGD